MALVSIAERQVAHFAAAHAVDSSEGRVYSRAALSTFLCDMLKARRGLGHRQATQAVRAQMAKIPRLSGPLLPFIKHEDAQAVLQDLRLPFISSGNLQTRAAGEAAISIADEADDGDGEVMDAIADIVDADNVAQGFAAASSASTVGGDVSDLDVGSGAASTGRSTGGSMPSQPSRVPSSETVGGSDAPEGEVAVGQALLPSPAVRAGRSRTGARRMIPSRMASLTLNDMQEMSQPNLLLLASRMATALRTSMQKQQSAAAKHKALVRQVRQQSTRLQTTEQKLGLAQEKNVMEIVPAGPSGKRMTSMSTFALALRRNMSNIAAADMSGVILHDVSAQTVVRAEIRTCAAINASMQTFCQNLLSLFPVRLCLTLFVSYCIRMNLHSTQYSIHDAGIPGQVFKESV